MTRTAHRRFSQAMAWLLVVSLTWSAERVSLAASPQNTSPRGWQELQTAAPGTVVQLTLTNRATMQGRLIEARPDELALNAIEVSATATVAVNTTLRDTQTFRRGEVAAVKIIGSRSRPSYRSSGGTPDAAVVRRVVTALGVGRTVNVKTTSARRVRTRILSIDDRGFTIRRGSSPAGLGVAYGDVMEVERAGMSGAGKGAIWGSVLFLIVLPIIVGPPGS